MPTKNLDISDLDVKEEIGRGASSTLYRAQKGERVMAVKLYRAEKDSAEIMASAAHRFHQEGVALARLRHPNLVQVLHVGETIHRPYLVLEYIDGPRLSDLIARGPLPEEQIARIGSAVAGALSEVHRHRLVHRDIKPDNVLIPPGQDAKLIDFGFVAEAQREAVDDAQIMGTMLYAAPEQTGMLKRAVDGRSDLYSLGCVLFECATGRAPFEAPTLSELIRKHAAESVPGASSFNPAITPALNAILEKLLAKDPDDRYQSGAGIIADLSRLAELNAALATGNPIQLGSNDVAVEEETSLVGREKEIARLRRKCEETTRGHGGVLLLEGDPGAGKSRLAREGLRGLDSTGTLILKSKCSKDDPVPFGPLRVAIEDYLSRVDKLAPQKRLEQQKRVRQASGEHAPFLKRFSPRLRRILDDVPDSRQEEAQDQFYDAIARFLLSLANQNSGVALYIDDVQWLDEASRRVLSRIVPHLRTAKFVLIVTSRNDPDSRAGLSSFLQLTEGALSERIAIGPLGDEPITRLIHDLLGGHAVDAQLCANLVSRSNGNPFAAGEFVRAMIEEGLIQFSWQRWTCQTRDLDRLDLPADVVSLVIRRLERLSTIARSVLRIAALQGMRVRIDLLCRVCARPSGEIYQAVDDALRARLLEREENQTFNFVHDRIRQAVLAELEGEDIPVIHQRIADALEEMGGEGDEYIYSLAYHWANGKIDTNPGRVFETNLAAGKIAVEKYANERGYEFLKQAETVAIRAKLAPHWELSLYLGEACLRLTREPEGIVSLEAAVAHAPDLLARARLRHKLAKAKLGVLDTEGAWEQVLGGFRDLGRPLPRSFLLQVLGSLAQWMAAIFIGRTGIGFGKVKGKERERHQILLELYITGGLVAYYRFQVQHCVVLGLRALYSANRVGPSIALASAYYSHATMMAILGWKKAADAYIRRAVEFAEQIGDRMSLAESKVYLALVREFTGDPIGFAESAREALNVHGQWLHQLNYIKLLTLLSMSLLNRGYVVEAEEWIRKLTRKDPTKESNEMIGAMAVLEANNAGLLAALGQIPAAAAAMSKAEECAARAKETSKWCRYSQGAYLTWRLLYHLHLGEWDEADRAVTQIETEIRTSPREVVLPILFYYAFKAHLRFAQAIRSTGTEREKRVVELEKSLKELKSLRKQVVILHGHYEMALAGLWWLKGKPARARRALWRAEAAAERYDCPWVTSEIHALKARFLQEEQPEQAKREADIAVRLADESSLASRARQLRRSFHLDEGSSAGRSFVPSGGESSRAQAPHNSARSIMWKRQLDALMQVSLATSSILDPDRQVRVILDEIVGILGAERAFLFRCGNDHGEIVLQAGRDQKKTDLSDAKGYSNTVVENVRASRKPTVIGSGDLGRDERAGTASIVLHDLRSIMAAPLMIGENLLGVVYLDNHLAKGVFTEDDLEILHALATHIAVTIEYAKAARLELEKRELEKNLEVTGAVQSLLIPQQSDWHSDTLALSGFFQPMEQCGGDWWWYDVMSNGSLLVLIGDVTGHGVGAAMMTATVAGAYRSLRLAASGSGNATLEVKGVLENLGAMLFGIGAGEYWMTMTAFLIDPAEKQLRYWNAGGLQSLLLRANGEIESLFKPCDPLGSGQCKPACSISSFLPGDRLLAFTDGVTEMRLPQGRELGVRKLGRMLANTRSLDLSQAKQGLVTELAAARANSPLHDDITFVLIEARRRSPADAGGE